VKALFAVRRGSSVALAYRASSTVIRSIVLEALDAEDAERAIALINETLAAIGEPPEPVELDAAGEKGTNE
jgi:hypothetical protein